MTRRLALAVLVACTPLSAGADPCTATRPLSEGKVAPCDGVLWPVENTREADRIADVVVPRLQADLQQLRIDSAADLELARRGAAGDLALAKRVAAADLALAKREVAADLKACEVVGDATRLALDVTQRAAGVAPPLPPAWFERPTVVWPTAALLGLVTGAGITWAVTR